MSTVGYFDIGGSLPLIGVRAKRIRSRLDKKTNTPYVVCMATGWHIVDYYYGIPVPTSKHGLQIYGCFWDLPTLRRYVQEALGVPTPTTATAFDQIMANVANYYNQAADFAMAPKLEHVKEAPKVYRAEFGPWREIAAGPTGNVPPYVAPVKRTKTTPAPPNTPTTAPIIAKTPKAPKKAKAKDATAVKKIEFKGEKGFYVVKRKGKIVPVTDHLQITKLLKKLAEADRIHNEEQQGVSWLYAGGPKHVIKDGKKVKLPRNPWMKRTTGDALIASTRKFTLTQNA